MPSAVQTKDPFNLSNDEHYNPKVMDSALRPNIGSSLIQVITSTDNLMIPQWHEQFSLYNCTKANMTTKRTIFSIFKQKKLCNRIFKVTVKEKKLK